MSERRRGDGEVLLSASVGSGLATTAIGCLGALAITPLVMIAVSYFSKPPDGVEALIPWFWLAAALFAVATIVVYLRARKRVELVDAPGGLAIRVAGQEIVRAPFDLEYGYQKVVIRHGAPRMTELILGVLQEGKPVATFREEWGMIHGTPDGWPEKWPVLPPGAPHHFRVLGARFCAKLVDLVERDAG